MGLQKKSQGNYVRLKDGKFFLGKDMENSYDELTGKITNLSFRNDEFEGTTVRKLVVTLTDDKNENYILSFPFESAYASSFVSFLMNADLNQELTIVPSMKVEGDKTSRNLFIKQDGNWLKAYFTKDNSHGQPAFKKVVKKSGKVEWDNEDFLEFRENIINTKLIPKINGNSSDKPKVVSAEVIEDTDVEDDLPF